MSTKNVLVLCVQALFIQFALSQCTSRAAIDASGYGAPYGMGGLGLAPGIAAPGLAGPVLAAPTFANAACTAPGLSAPALAYDGLAYPGAGFGGVGLGYDGLYAPAMEIAPTSGGGFIVSSSSPIPPSGLSVVSEADVEGILTVVGDVPFVGTTGMEGVLPTVGSAAVNHACGNGLNVMSSDASIAIAPMATIAPSIAIAPAVAPVAAFTPALVPAAFGGCGKEIVY